MRKIFKKQKLLEVLFIVTISLTPLLWLKNGEVIMGHDTGFFLDPLARLKTYFYAWMPYEGLGMDYSLYRAFLITLFPHAFFGFLTGSLAWAQRLTFIFWFFVMGISMYAFAKYLLPKKKDWPFRLIASTYYVYNFFILQAWFIAERAKFSLYAALPLVLMVLLKPTRCELGVLPGSIYFALILFFLNGGGSPPLYGFIVAALAVYYFYFLVKSIITKDFGLIKRLSLTYIAFLAAFVILNFYWIYPQFKYYLSSYSAELASRGGVSGQVEWLIETSKHTSWFNLLRLQGIPSWYDNHPYADWFINNTLSAALSLFVPLVILLGFLKSRLLLRIDNKSREILIICFLLLPVSLIASAGSQPPFGSLYIFAIKYIPGFAIFRNAFYKFASGLWFSEILLFSYFINYLIAKTRFKNIIASALIIGVLAFHYPYFGQDVFTLDDRFSTKLVVPDYVYQMSDYVTTKTPLDTRILILPPIDPKTGVDAYEWGFYSLDNLPKSALTRSIITNIKDSSGLMDDFYKAMEDGDNDLTVKIAQVLGINKILWRGDIVYPHDVNIDNAKLITFKNNLDNNQYFQKEVEYGKWVLYDFQRGSHVYATADVVSTNGEAAFVFKKEETAGNAAFIGLENYDPAWQNLVMQPACSGCDFNRGIVPSEYLFIPEIKYNPGTILYKTSRILESQRLNQATTPQGKIDALLVGVAKRVGEMRDFGVNQKMEDEFAGNMDLVVKNFSKLSHNNKIFYSLRIIDYLNHLENYYDGAGDYKKYFEPWVWKTESYENIKMVVDIPSKSVFEIIAKDYTNLYIDEREIGDQRVEFDQGLHKLSVKREKPENLLKETALNESFENNFFYPIGEINKNQPYLLAFKYKIESDKPVWFSVENGSRFEELKLYSDGAWHEFSHLFSANGPSGINIFSKNENGGIKLNITDMYLHAFSLPEFYFYKQREKSGYPSINLESRQISPVEYELLVSEDISDEFLIVFNENFSDGWKLAGIDGKHTKVNGFANGWLVDGIPQGKYRIYYEPQKYYTIGIYVTFASLLITSFITYRKIKK